MGDFEVKDYWKIYLNQEAKERVRKIQDHLEKNYDSRSEFLRDKLEEEKALSIEERIRRVEEEKQEKDRKLERLKEIKRERDKKEKLREKREKLKKKQEELRELSEEGGKTEEQIREEIKEEALESKPPRYSDEEYLEKQQGRIERKVESRLDDDRDVDSLVSEVETLQDEIAELNGGEEDFFMDLEADSGGVRP